MWVWEWEGFLYAIGSGGILLEVCMECPRVGVRVLACGVGGAGGDWVDGDVGLGSFLAGSKEAGQE